MNALTHIVMLLIILFLLHKNYSKKIIWFYRPDCSYCRQMEPEWNKFQFKAVFTMFPPIEAKKVNINEVQNYALSQNYGVNSVPFIVKLGRDGIRNTYDGERISDDIFKWACV
jgi:hypothetical protein